MDAQSGRLQKGGICSLKAKADILPPAQALRFQCSPYYVNSAFWPVIDNFERALKFARDETADAKLDKLEALIVSG